MELNFLDIISLFIAFISVLFALFLLSVKSRNYLSNVLIAIFLITYAQDSASQFVGIFVYPKHPGLAMLINMTVYLNMPALYLYILSTMYSDFSLKKKDLLHLLPLFIIILVFIPNYFSKDFDGKNEFWEESHQNKRWEITFTYIFLHLQILFYIILSYWAVYKYKRLLLENFSNASMFNYKWIYQLITLLAFESLFAGFKNVFMFLDLESLFFNTLIITSLIALGLICWMVLKALQAPELFRGISSDMQLAKDYKTIENSDQDGMPVVEINSIKIRKLEALDQFMIENKPYLDASLTVYDLANQLDVPKQELSLLINKDLNQHFFDFINAYRIRLAMDILKDPLKKDFTVLEILYEVGFNSKSSFNTAFKKVASLTPTEYRRKYLPA